MSPTIPTIVAHTGPSRVGNAHPFSDRILVRPIFLRERLVDHGDRRRIELVLRSEEAAFEERHLHGAEVIRRDEPDLFVRPRMSVVHWATFD